MLVRLVQQMLRTVADVVVVVIDCRYDDTVP